jgi:hypothetical protein
MNRSIVSRLHKPEARAGLDCSVENMTDGELFSTFLNIIQRAGGAEAFAEVPKDEGEERLAESVLQCAACTTAAEFMVVEHQRRKGTRPKLPLSHVG